MLSGMETMELNGMKTDLFFSFLLLAEICQVPARSFVDSSRFRKDRNTSMPFRIGRIGESLHLREYSG